ncbi:MAG: tRNA (adenosine(37)-N6)-dimethylallyltransferase MiaA [Myxococcota bacterium]
MEVPAGRNPCRDAINRVSTTAGKTACWILLFGGFKLILDSQEKRPADLAQIPPDLPIVLAGPTGSGKSRLALELAQRLNGELICADSRQVYVGMTIGTASPTRAQKRLVPHHGYNVQDPARGYDVARFVQEADRIVREVRARGRLPILVGGTGLYLRVWRIGLDSAPDADNALRARLRQELLRHGPCWLHDRLRNIDPPTARRIDPQDSVRVVRALEIHERTGEKPSVVRPDWRVRPGRVRARWLLLRVGKEELNERIARRAHWMVGEALVEEACALRRRLGDSHPLTRTMGYEEALAWSDGRLSRQQALERVIIRHRQYAKRQRTWFNAEPWWAAERLC